MYPEEERWTFGEDGGWDALEAVVAQSKLPQVTEVAHRVRQRVEQVTVPLRRPPRPIGLALVHWPATARVMRALACLRVRHSESGVGGWGVAPGS